MAWITNRVRGPVVSCPDMTCATSGGTGPATVTKYGRTAKGVQRFQCSRCKKTFTETKGTPFYRRRTDELELLASSRQGSKSIRGRKEASKVWRVRAATLRSRKQAVEKVEHQDFRDFYDDFLKAHNSDLNEKRSFIESCVEKQLLDPSDGKDLLDGLQPVSEYAAVYYYLLRELVSIAGVHNLLGHADIPPYRPRERQDDRQ